MNRLYFLFFVLVSTFCISDFANAQMGGNGPQEITVTRWAYGNNANLALTDPRAARNLAQLICDLNALELAGEIIDEHENRMMGHKLVSWSFGPRELVDITGNEIDGWVFYYKRSVILKFKILLML